MLKFLYVGFAVFALSSVALAQNATGTLDGRVIDSSGPRFQGPASPWKTKGQT